MKNTIKVTEGNVCTGDVITQDVRNCYLNGAEYLTIIVEIRTRYLSVTDRRSKTSRRS